MGPESVAWLTDPECQEVDLVGGKGASLGRMTGGGLTVPPGFVVPAGALEASLQAAGSLDRVKAMLDDMASSPEPAQVAEGIRKEVEATAPTDALAEAVTAAYGELGDDPAVAVRSSACAEDGQTASYAGQQETYLNVIGAESVLAKVTACWASFFAERAVFYRKAKGSLGDLGMAVVVQRLIDSDKSGVMFTIDPVRRRRDQLVIEAAYGLGEALVSGLVTPDNYIATRDGAIKRSFVARQELAIVRDSGGGTVERTLTEEQAAAAVLDADEVRQLVDMGLRLEGIFGEPQDVEWAFEGGELYLLQSRPITA